jgi:manganese/iron transport system permease protein
MLPAALLDPLQYPFMGSGLLDVLLLGVACGLIGPFVVQRNLTFFGHALSHTIFPSLVVANVLGVAPLTAAVLGALLTVGLVFQLQHQRHIGDDCAVGIVFVGLFALGVVLVGWLRPKAPDVSAAVVGNLLGVSGVDLVVSAALVLVLLISMALLYRPLVLASFDRLAAQALGLPIVLIDLVVLGAVAATAVVGVKVVGVILTVTLLVTPAAAARQWSNSLPHMMTLSVGFVWLAGTISLYTAYYVRIAPAAIVVLVLAGAFVASLVLGAHSPLRVRPRGSEIMAQ